SRCSESPKNDRCSIDLPPNKDRTSESRNHPPGEVLAGVQLTPEQQDALRAAAADAIKTQREQVAANEAEMVSTLEEQGMTVNDVPDVTVFRDKVGPVYEQFRSSIGEDLFDRTLAAVGGNEPASAN
ncbi:hypothetical protein K7I14_17540, partial [Aurantimonas coralicida]|nr:hypothetical protein [Aurantimonas coralicida]